MTRTTVRAGNHWIEVELVPPQGWEINVIPIKGKGTPTEKHIAGTYKEMLQWVLTHTGQYVMLAIEGRD